MKLKTLTLLAGSSLLMMAVSAQAQSPYDLTNDRIRIQNDECPLTGCLNFTDAASANASLQGLASSLSSNSSSEVKQNNGRGLAQGQQNNEPQLVYLAFGSADPTFNVFFNGVPFAGGVFNDYIYNQEDRDFVQSRMEADFAEYNFEFTQTQPSQGDFSTIRIGDNDANPIDLAGGILFGRADNIDFGNNVRGDSAFADASFWQFLAELDVMFGNQNLANFLGLPGPLDADGIETFRRIAVLNQSANTSAHELGHILGLRHHDSFGAPGDGLPLARDPGEFLPLTDLDQEAVETLSHIMASGASAGLALNSPPFVDRFFSERSAVKLAVNERTRTITEEAAMINGGLLKLNKVVGANPLLDGVNSGGKLDIRAALIDGSMENVDDVDVYKIKARKGEIFNAELITTADRTNAMPVFFSKLSLQQVMDDGSLVEVVSNQLTFEGRNPLIFDFTIPDDGNYVLEVSAPDLVPVAPGVFVSLADFGFTDLRVGSYEMLAYVVEGKSGKNK